MSAAANGPSRQRKPRTEPELSVPRLVTPDNQTDGVVRITLGQVTADSFLTPIRSRIGRGFLVEKSSRDGSEGPYLVSLVGDKWTCDCKGHRRYGHCKHADGLAALVAAGRL